MLLAFELLDARPFDLGLALAGRDRPRMRIGRRLPGGKGLLAALEPRRRRALLDVRRVQTRDHGGKLAGQRFELIPVALDHAGELLHLSLRLLRIRALPLLQLARMLNVLLDARHVGARRVEPLLNGAESLAFRGLIDPDSLDFRLRLAQVCDRSLHRGLTTFGGRIAHARLYVEPLQAQREHLRLKFALLLLEHLVPAGGGGLALQMADLLVHFLAQIVQALQVFARLGDAALGFPTTPLVARYPRRLFQKCTQVVGPRLDDARDHALLDDAVAARAEAGAEKELRDVLAPDLDPVDEIIRGPVPAHGAPQRDLVVGRVGSPDLAVRVIEHELHRCAAQGLARRGAVEDHVRHRLAAQMPRGDFAHHPAHRIDDVRFPATVRTDDARQTARESDRGRVDE